jgi:hypothetical protein
VISDAQLSRAWSESSRFFDSIFAKKEDDSFITIGHRTPRTLKWSNQFATDATAAADLTVELLAREKEIFFGVNPVYEIVERKGNGFEFNLSHSRKNIREVYTFHADVDNISHQQLRALINRLEPTKINTSGGKNCYHIYYVSASQPAQPWQGEIINRNLQEIVGGDPQAVDISRRLRPPGTFNWKSGEPRLVETIAEGPQYPFETIWGKFGCDLDSDARHVVAPRRERGMAAEDRRYAEKLLKGGLSASGQRNKAILCLIRYFQAIGYTQEQTSDAVIAVFRAGLHNGKSKDWNANSKAVEQHIRSATRRSFERVESGLIHHQNPVARRNYVLSESDERFIEGQNITRHDEEFLRACMTWIANNRRGKSLVMSKRKIWEFPNCHSRNYIEKEKLLINLKILKRTKRYGRSVRLADEYLVQYTFQP